MYPHQGAGQGGPYRVTFWRGGCITITYHPKSELLITAERTGEEMSLARYALRYFFDPGSGICLWAACDAARQRFGYPVAARELPLPRATRERMAQLVDWFDHSVDWECPAGPSLWDAAEADRFARAARQLLSVLRVQLGPDFEIRDELAVPVTV